MKKKYLLFMIAILLPINVKAFEYKCDKKNVDYGSSVSCYLYADTENEYTYIKGDFKIPEEFSCESKTELKGKITNESFNLSGKPTNKKVLETTCTVKEKKSQSVSANLIIDNFKYKIGASESDTLVMRSDLININPMTTTSRVTKPKNVANSNALLLSLSDENLDFEFTRFVTDYDISVLFEIEAVNLKYQPVNPESRVEIVGSQKLELGLNVIDIYVTDTEGNKVCYTLNITRLARGEKIYYKEDDATLAGLTLPEHSFKFDKDIDTYTISVSSDVEEIKVVPILNYEKASFVITGNTDIKNGSIITILVTSESKTNTKKYTIKVKKALKKKDYMIYFFLGLAVTIILILIIFIVRISDRDKDDILTTIRNKKNKKNEEENKDVPVVDLATNQVNQPVNQVTSEVANQPVNQVTSEAANQPVNQVANEPANQPINQVANEPANQPVNQVPNETVNQPVNQVPNGNVTNTVSNDDVETL